MSEFVKGHVGEAAEHLITAMRDEQDDIAVGNVLRQACQWAGKNACKETCQLKAAFKKNLNDTDLYIDFQDRQGECADQNLDYVLSKEALIGGNVLIVGVNGNKVGFADRMEEYDVAQKPNWENIENDENGWKELPEFSAFFAREDELDALGRRLADCADVNFEFKDSESNTVIGFEHGTRTNMFGESEYRFEREGEKVSYTEHVIGQAIEHYTADPKSIKIKLAAAIEGQNYTWNFDDSGAMEHYLPGWLKAGYLTNRSYPTWELGDDVVKSDTWEADTRGMIIDDIRSAMEKFGIPIENFNMDGIIDPADEGSLHSSHQKHGEFDFGDTRDLYMTYIPPRSS